MDTGVLVETFTVHTVYTMAQMANVLSKLNMLLNAYTMYAELKFREIRSKALRQTVCNFVIRRGEYN